jgi:hypothetical protein
MWRFYEWHFSLGQTGAAHGSDVIGVTVRRESRWTSEGVTHARCLLNVAGRRLVQYFGVFCLGLFQGGDVGVGVFQEREESSVGLCYWGSLTFRTNSANLGSERMGSSKKLVFKRPSSQSRS